MTSAWIPVSSSLFNRTATNITIISFANNIIGDRLSLYSTEKLQFHIIMSGIDLYAQSASKFSGYTYDLNPSYTQYTSNFGFLFTSSTDLTMN
jgi:outer membrane receptor for ferric coprogen and ferric-rhodotorulic acid